MFPKRTLAVLFAVSLMWSLAACKDSEEKKAPAPMEPQKQEAPAQAEKAAPERVTGPIAKVNGTAIDSARFYGELDKITQGGARNIPEDRLAKIRQNILNRLIEETLLSQEIKKQEIKVTEEEQNVKFDQYKARFKSEQQFENYLKHGRTGIDEIKKRLKQSTALAKLLTKLGKLEVLDEDVAKAYETGIKMYTEPEQMHAKHILVKVAENADDEKLKAAKARVKEAMKKLKGGADFGKVAKEYSDDAMSREKGGDLGFFRKGVMVPKFEEAAFALKKGQTTKKPVRTPFGFHIIKALEHKTKRIKPLDEVKEQIQASLKNKNTFKSRRELVERLKKEADIEKFIEEPKAK